MEKTKLSIPTTVVAAIACLFALYGGYLITAVLVGYVLLKEENAWLKKFCIKIFVLMLAFSLASTALNLIPNLLELLNSLLQIFDDYINLDIIYRIFNFFSQALNLFEVVLFILMAIFALSGKDVKFAPVDKFLDKYIA